MTVIPEFIKDALKALQNEGYEAYIVGGAVRDSLRGVAIHDFDLTTSALPEQTAKIMTDKGFKTIIDQSSKYGTVVFIDPNDNSKRVEITTYRSDSGYSDARHPDSVTFTTSLEEDAARRDFTVNSLYMDADGNIKDPNNGRSDIEDKIIRAVGNPDRRFKEDALRILRAVRFEAQTGFTIEEKTAQAMKDNAELLSCISAERVMKELTGIVTAANGPAAIRHSLEVVSVIIPELLIQRDFDQKSKFHDRDLLTHTLDVLGGIPLNEDGVKDTSLAFAALLHDIGKPEMFTIDENGVGHMKKHNVAGYAITKRLSSELKFSNQMRDEVLELVLYHDTFPEPEKKTIRKLVSALGIPLCNKLFELQKSDVEAHSVYGKPRIERLAKIIELYHEILEEKPCLTTHDLAITGDDIIGLGVMQGPKVGEILHDILNKVMDEILINDHESLIRYVTIEYKADCGGNVT